MYKLNSKRALAFCLCISLFFAFFVSGCKTEEDEYITGNEWLVIQKTCLTDLEAYMTGVDEVFSLYLVGGMTESDFLVELRLLEQQYNALVQFRDELKAENPVKEGSHSYASKRGTDALDAYYDTIGDLLENVVDEEGKPYPADQLSYIYIAYEQTLSDYLATFVTAIVWYEEAQKE